MASVATDRSPEFSLPLRYFSLGILAYLFTALGVTAMGPDLASSVWNPRLIALTHVMTLGAVVAMIMGACYQLVPVVMLAPIWSAPLGKAVFWIYLPGVLAMVGGFAAGQPAWLGAGATGVGLAIAAFLLNILVSLVKGATWNMVGAFMVTSLASLAAAVSLGMIRAFSYLDPAGAWPIPDAMAVHAHLAAFGCAALLIFGVSYRLLPMFAVSAEADRHGWMVLALSGLGVAGLALGFLLQQPLVVRAGAVLAAAGALTWAWDARKMYAVRVRRQLDAGLTYSATAVMWLLLTVLMGLAMAWGLVPAAISADRWAIAYAMSGLFGFIGFTVIGQFYKIQPFLAWYHRYSSLVGKAKVPLIKDIYDEKLAWYGFWASQGGLALGLISVLAAFGPGIRLSGILLTLGALATAGMTAQTLKR